MRPTTWIPALFGGLVLLLAGTAGATERPSFRVRSLDVEGPGKSDREFAATLLIEAGEPGAIEDFALEGDGWTFDFELDPVGRWLETGESIRIPYRARPRDPDTPFTVSVRFNGQLLVKNMDASASAYQRVRGAADMMENPEGRSSSLVPKQDAGPHPAPAPATRRAPRDRVPELQTVVDESHDINSELSQKKARTITVSGRFIYIREGGRLTGVDAATVRVYDEDVTWDELLGELVTDQEGFWSLTFTWDPGIFDDSQPDIYVEFELQNDVVTVQDPGIFEEDYTFVTGTVDDFTGTNLSFGWQQPAEEWMHPAPHIHNNIVRSWRWILAHEGYDTPSVDVQWPETGTGAWHSGFYDEIYITNERSWREPTHWHEYGHHFQDEFADTDGTDYCNGLCDNPGDCGHCFWCQETAVDAYNEGWPNWFADVITRSHFDDYGYGTRYVRSQETPGACMDTAGNPCPCDPLRTEGFMGLVLRDIEDDDFGDWHGFVPGVRDRLALGTDEIFAVAILDDPQTPMQFLSAFQARFPQYTEDLWETAKNSGYEIDVANPGAVSNLVSPSHVVGVESPNAAISLEWTRAPDDASGVDGYAVHLGVSPSLPSPTKTIGDVTEWTTDPLPVGSFYVSLRAVDRAGNWSAEYTTAGPFSIRAAIPANLAHVKSTGWADIVIPSAIANASPGSVPTPTSLIGNGNTYWNVAPRNVGDDPTGTVCTARVFVDGARYLDLFNPSEGAASIPSLAGSSFVEILNQGPINVRPGRHMFAVALDDFGAVIELDENDNGWGRQWIWQPSTMPVDQWLGTTTLPDRDGGFNWNGGISLWPNAWGLRYESSGWWNAVYMIANHPDSDFDLRQFPDSSSPLNGFALPWDVSSRPAGCVDAVFVNRNATGVTEPWDVGVVQSDLEKQSGGFGYRHIVSTYVVFGTEHVDQLTATEAMHLREFLVGAATTGPVSLVLDIDPADGPLQIALLGSSFTTGALLDYDAHAMTDANGRARIDVVMSSAGYNCAVVFRDAKDGPYSTTVPYTLRIDTTTPDLGPSESIAGWDAPIIPRPASDGTPSSVPEPTSLAGWQPTTWINVAQENAAPTDAPGPLDTSVRIDGVEILAVPIAGGIAAGSTLALNNLGPVNVRGGRHTISLHSDASDDIDEFEESNNVFGAQWGWSGKELQQSPVVGMPQPEPRTGGWNDIDPETLAGFFYNSDGFRTPSYNPVVGGDEWWVAAAVAPGPNSDVDIRFHPMDDNPETAFSTTLAYSGWAPGQTDFVLLNYYLADPGSYDVGILGLSGSEGYQRDLALVQQHGAPGGQLGPFNLQANELVALHEFWLDPKIYTIELENLGGGADLGFSLHGWQLGHQGKSDHVDGGLAWLEPEGMNEEMRVTIDQAGPYCLAVWKSASSDASLNADYSINFLSITDAPPETRFARSAIRNVVPNPFNPRTEIEFVLAEPGPIELTVYNLRGERVRTLERRSFDAGRHRVLWSGLDESGRAVAGGVYFVRLHTASGEDRRKITLLK